MRSGTRRESTLDATLEEDAMKMILGSLLGAALLIPLLGGCQRGHYTDDRHYIGDPERVESASEVEQEHRKTREQLR